MGQVFFVVVKKTPEIFLEYPFISDGVKFDPKEVPSRALR